MRSLSASPTRLWPKATDPPPLHIVRRSAKTRAAFFVPQILSDTRSPASLLPESAVFRPVASIAFCRISRNCRTPKRNVDSCVVIFDVLLFHSQN